MSHRAQQIVDAVAGKLVASATLGASVYKHRRESLDEGSQELAAVVVDYGADDPLSDLGASNVAFLDSLLEVRTRIVLRASSEEEALEGLLGKRVAVHVALMADRSQGLAFVIDTRYSGAEPPGLDSGADRVVGSLVCRWLVHYRMNLTDPS